MRGPSRSISAVGCIAEIPWRLVTGEFISEFGQQRKYFSDAIMTFQWPLHLETKPEDYTTHESFG
jgi:hypothetical protein